MKSTLFIATLFIGSFLFAQQQIVGFAPSFIGKDVKIYTYQEYITMKKVPIAEGTVSAADSLFKIDFDVKTTVKGVIEIDGTEGVLYLAPNSNYEVIFPSVKGLTSFGELNTELIFLNLDSTDINYRILQYHQWFDSYIYLYRGNAAQFHMLLDTFKVDVAEAYKDVQDVYFLTYVRYNIAEMEQAFGGNSNAERRLETYLTYIDPFPVYFENDQYMKFVKRFYEQDFDDYDPETEAEIFAAINQASPTLLMKAMKRDLFLVKPELREMVMIDKLGKQFYMFNEDKPKILLMLDSLSTHAKFQVGANIAKNVRDYLTTLEPGYPAPYISLDYSADSTLYWKNYEGKFVYFNFFSTWNEKARTEMKVIKQLKDKYEEDITFLSVCTDKDSSSYKKYLADNPTFDWDILYIGAEHELMELYKVQTVPAYFLINQGGYIYAAPALAPSPSGAEYFSIDKTFFDIQSALHPKEEYRPGER